MKSNQVMLAEQERFFLNKQVKAAERRAAIADSISESVNERMKIAFQAINEAISILKSDANPSAESEAALDILLQHTAKAFAIKTLKTDGNEYEKY